MKFLRALPCWVILSACLLLSGRYAQGQANEFLFTATDTTYVPVNIDSTVGTVTNDNTAYLVPLKFPFPFGAYTYTSIRVSPNGFVLFGTGTMSNGINTAYQSTNFPSGRVFNATNASNNLTFLAFNQNLEANGIPIGLKWGGSAPNRWLVVQYAGFRRAPTNYSLDQINFQIAIYESGRLEARYGAMSAISTTNTGSMVGIRGQNRNDIFPLRGTWANPVPGIGNLDSIDFSNSDKPVAGRRFRFTPAPAAAANLRVTAVAPANGTITGCPRSTTETLNLTVQNGGNQPVSAFQAGYRLGSGTPVSRSVTLPNPLAPGASTTVALSGTQGVDLSRYQTYLIKGFVNQANDVNRRNDTARLSLTLKAPTSIPNTIVATFANLAAQGWRKASGRPIRPSDSANVWRSSAPFIGNPTIGAYMDAGNAAIQEWLYRPGLLAGGPVSLSFKMATTLNFSGTTPVPNLGDDTLKVMVSHDCGLTWSSVAAFDNGGYQAGLFGNSLREFSYVLTDQPGPIAVAFYVTANGTGAPAPYRWHLDDIKFEIQDDLAVTAFLAASQTRFSGCAGSSQEPILVRVQNNGSDSIRSATVGYRINNGTPVVQTVNFRPALRMGQDTVIVFSGAQAADLSQPIPYNGIAFVNITGDGNPGNDTLALSIDLTYTEPVPFADVVESFADSRLKGWRQLSGRNTPGNDSTGFWRASTALSSPTIAGYQPANATARAEWYFRGGYRSSGRVGIRFKMAVAAGTGSTPLSSMGNDTLYVKASQDCGRTWNTVATFTQAGLGTQFTNNLSEFTYMLTSSGGPLSVAFYFSNGGDGSTNAYSVHLDDIQFLVDKDIAVTGIAVANAGRFYGCPLGSQQAVTVTVQNLGLGVVTNATVSYSLNGGTVVNLTYTFPGGLANGQSAQVTFSGANGADMSQPGPYQFTAIARQSGEENTKNDSLETTIELQPTFAIPGLPTIGTYTDAKIYGWKQVGGWPIQRDTSLMWRNAQPVYGPLISALVQTTDTSRAEWFYHTGLVSQGPVGIRFKLGVATGTGGVSPVGTLGDDTLKVIVSYDCGNTWATLARYHEGTRAAGTLDNTLKEFTVSLASSAASITVAFVVNTKGTAATEVYRWLLDDIAFLAANDLGTRGLSVNSLRFSGCARSNSETVDVIVRNAGSLPVGSAEVGYIVNDEAPLIKTVSFSPALQPGEQRIVRFSGAEGADLSATIDYSFKAFVTLTGDGSILNDTAYASLEAGTETTLPGVPSITDFQVARNNGWSVGKNWPLLIDSSTVWKQTNAAVGTAVAAEFSNLNDVVQDWFYHTGYRTNGPITMRFQIAVARGTAGQSQAVTTLEDDSLVIMASYDCGRSWSRLASYTQADLAAGNLSNTFTTKSVDISTGPQAVTIAFYATNNRTRNATTYRWLIDNIDFGTGTDLEATSLGNPSTIASYCNNEARPVSLTVRNNGFTQIDSVTLGYRYAGGSEVRHTFRQVLPSLASATLVFPRNLWVVPTLPSGELKVYVVLTTQSPGASGNDTVLRTLTVPPTRALPTAVFFSLNTFLSNSFYQVRERNGVEVPAQGWFAGRVGSNNTAYTSFGNQDSAGVRNWLISPSYLLGQGAVVRFRAAVVAQSGTANVGNDSLLLMYRNNCGQWAVAKAFTQADITSGAIGGTLQNFTVNMPVGGGMVTQLAFVGTNGGTPNVPSYSWHITSLDMQDRVSALTLETETGSEMLVYPNPASTLLMIEASSSGDGIILNASGQTIKKFTLVNGKKQLSIVELPNGLYTIVLPKPNATIIRRFIKN